MFSIQTLLRSLLLLFVLLIPALLKAQGEMGELRGSITSEENGEGLPRATVQLVDTKLGAYADLKGIYTIRKVPAGRYKVRVSYAGYVTQDVEGVDVGVGLKQLDVVLKLKRNDNKITVATKQINGTDGALLNQRRKSANVSDGISAAQIRRLSDATGADALSRVTGISVVRGTYANIRGSNERYNNTQLNGVTLVSTDPGKRAFSFDLVPSNLLASAVVAKTFTPDLPGDFSGGLVQLNTIDFPDQRSVRVSLGANYAPGSTFEPLVMGPRGSTDWLGIDDGTRELPATFSDSTRINGEHYSGAQLVGFAKQLPNTFALAPVHAGPNLNFTASYGDRIPILDNDFGLVAAVSYRNSYDHTNIERYDTTVGSEARFNYRGYTNEYSSLWGGLLNLSYKLSDLHTISVRNTYNHTAEDQITFVEGVNYYFPADQKRYIYHYLQRSFYSGQVGGEHLFPELGDLRVQWRAFTSLGDRHEPDLRRAMYLRTDIGDTSLPYMVVLSTTASDPYGNGRVYTDLSEELAGGNLDFTLPIGPARLKFGAFDENKAREVATRSFVYATAINSTIIDTTAIGDIYSSTHVESDSITVLETTQASDRYDAASHTLAGYLMTDLPFELFDQKFRTILGARYEQVKTLINTVDNNSPLNVSYTTVDWLPAASLIYEIIPEINLRLAYSKTLSRPDFREFARYAFFDFIQEALTYGNPSLRRTRIDNYDARIEYFPAPGELIALSGFHKKFTDAIEEVTLGAGSPERTWKNTNGTNTGFEVEVRKSFGFIAEDLAPLSFTVNYTWLDSRLDLNGGASDSIAGRRERRLQGQSPYIINVGLFYDNVESGTSATIAYNRFGERITTVARDVEPDFIEQPRDRIDLSVSQILWTNYELKLSVRDLFPQDVIVTQYGRPTRIDSRTSSISLGITAKF